MKKRWIAFLLVLSLLPLARPIPAIAENSDESQAEPTVVTMAFTAADPGLTWKDSNEVQQLKEKLNITLDYEYYDDDKFALLLASGNLPDIVMPRQQHLPSIIDNNMALNLDPYLDEYSNLDLEPYQSSNELSRKMLGGEDEKLLFLAPGLGLESAIVSETTGRGYVVRWDLYKELGCPPINSEEDYLQVLKDMVALDPETDNGEKVYGIGLYDDLSAWYTRGGWVRSGGAVCIWTYTGSLYMAGIDDTELYNGYMNPDRSAFWTDMRFYNKLYNEGLLDPDSFIMSSDDYLTRISSGRYVGGMTASNALYIENCKSDPETLEGLVTIASPNAVVGARKLQVSGGMPTDTIFVSAKTEQPEAALTVLNYFADPDVIRMTYSGLEGESWNYDSDGNPVLTDEAIAIREKYGLGTEEYGKETGIYGQIYNFTRFQGTAIHPDGHFYDLFQSPEYRVKALDPMRRDIAKTFDVERPSQVFMEMVAEGKTIDNLNDFAQLVLTGVPPIPMDIQRIIDRCNEIVYTAVPSLVMAENDEEFEQVMEDTFEELKNADENQAWEWCKENFDASKKELEPIFQDAKTYYENALKDIQ